MLTVLEHTHEIEPVVAGHSHIDNLPCAGLCLGGLQQGSRCIEHLDGVVATFCKAQIDAFNKRIGINRETKFGIYAINGIGGAFHFYRSFQRFRGFSPFVFKSDATLIGAAIQIGDNGYIACALYRGIGKRPLGSVPQYRDNPRNR